MEIGWSQTLSKPINKLAWVFQKILKLSWVFNKKNKLAWVSLSVWQPWEHYIISKQDLFLEQNSNSFNFFLIFKLEFKVRFIILREWQPYKVII